MIIGGNGKGDRQMSNLRPLWDGIAAAKAGAAAEAAADSIRTARHYAGHNMRSRDAHMDKALVELRAAALALGLKLVPIRGQIE